MFTLLEADAFAKSANVANPIPANVAIIVADDDFGPDVDSPVWDEWEADSAASDAVCSGAVL